MAIIFKGLQSIEGNLDGKDASTSSTLTFASECTEAPLTVGDIAISAAVASAAGLDIGSAYPFDPRSYCRKISSRCTGRRSKSDTGAPIWHWITTVEFSSATDTGNESAGPPEQGGFGTQKDPTLRPPKISLAIRPFDEPVDVDINGQQVKNSAGDPIVRTRKNAHLVVRWEKYMRKWDWRHNRPVHVGGFLFSRNSAKWKPAGVYSPLLGTAEVDIGCAQMQSITSEISFADGGCVFVAVDIAIDDNAFLDRFLDQGFFHLADRGVSSSEVPDLAPARIRRRFVDRNGVMTGPQLLDGAGMPLPDGNPPNTPVVIQRQYYGLKNWDADPWGPVANRGRFFSYPIGV